MKYSVISSNGSSTSYQLEDITPSELEGKVALFMTNEGYILKDEVQKSYTYTKGNRVLRILFGAFCKYNKIIITMSAQGAAFIVSLHKQSSGISGGLIGMQQVKKEYERINIAFEEYLKGSN